MGKPSATVIWALIFLAGLALAGCGPRGATLDDPSAPPGGYQRKIVLLLHRPDFRPVAGARVKIAAEAPTRLISPAGGEGRTDAQGALELLFEPLPHYDQKVLDGGDIVAEFPIKAYLTITGVPGAPLLRLIDDKESFARYADPLFHGLNRNPEAETTYYRVSIGN